MSNVTFYVTGLFLFLLISLSGCSENPATLRPTNPDTAPTVAVDRFSDAAGTLFRRSNNPGLPGPNEPIDFDQAPFINKNLGPNGETTTCYNFDMMPKDPAGIYVLFRKDENTPVEGQLNIIDVIPGGQGYNDFWQIVRVIVPSDYKANTVTSFTQIQNRGYKMETTNRVVNCPVVPTGSTADVSYESTDENELHRGWYRGLIVRYFTFIEKPLKLKENGDIRTSQLYVTFNSNPGDPGGESSSGFKTEPGGNQTHNVSEILPKENNYSPLWSLNIYDNDDFSQISDLTSAQEATILATGATNINCPIVNVETSD